MGSQYFIAADDRQSMATHADSKFQVRHYPSPSCSREVVDILPTCHIAFKMEVIDRGEQAICQGDSEIAEGDERVKMLNIIEQDGGELHDKIK